MVLFSFFFASVGAQIISLYIHRFLSFFLFHSLTHSLLLPSLRLGFLHFSLSLVLTLHLPIFVSFFICSSIFSMFAVAATAITLLRTKSIKNFAFFFIFSLFFVLLLALTPAHKQSVYYCVLPR